MEVPFRRKSIVRRLRPIMLEDDQSGSESDPDNDNVSSQESERSRTQEEVRGEWVNVEKKSDEKFSSLSPLVRKNLSAEVRRALAEVSGDDVVSLIRQVLTSNELVFLSELESRRFTVSNSNEKVIIKTEIKTEQPTNSSQIEYQRSPSNLSSEEIEALLRLEEPEAEQVRSSTSSQMLLQLDESNELTDEEYSQTSALSNRMMIHPDDEICSQTSPLSNRMVIDRDDEFNTPKRAKKRKVGNDDVRATRSPDADVSPPCPKQMRKNFESLSWNEKIKLVRKNLTKDPIESESAVCLSSREEEIGELDKSFQEGEKDKTKSVSEGEEAEDEDRGSPSLLADLEDGHYDLETQEELNESEEFVEREERTRPKAKDKFIFGLKEKFPELEDIDGEEIWKSLEFIESKNMFPSCACSNRQYCNAFEVCWIFKTHLMRGHSDLIELGTACMYRLTKKSGHKQSEAHHVIYFILRNGLRMKFARRTALHQFFKLSKNWVDRFNNLPLSEDSSCIGNELRFSGTFKRNYDIDRTYLVKMTALNCGDLIKLVLVSAQNVDKNQDGRKQASLHNYFKTENKKNDFKLPNINNLELPLPSESVEICIDENEKPDQRGNEMEDEDNFHDILDCARSSFMFSSKT